MSTAATAPPWLYRSLSRLLSPLLLAYTVWRTLKDGSKRYLAERLGLYSVLPTSKTEIPRRWIHAASVGEVFTVLPLVKALHEPMLVTTMSPTGASVLLQQGLAHVQHIYLPLDFPGACQRFFQHANIKSGWIVETEIWPWLYARARAHEVPLTIINARLSDKTMAHADGLLAKIYRRALSDVSVLARSQEDARRFETLGSMSVTTVGNLKYAVSREEHTDKPGQVLIDRPYVLAASTHDDEEWQLARAWQQAFALQQPAPLLVMVPRHPERGNNIRKQLTDMGMRCGLRSLQETVTTVTEVYVGDTLGEMQAWYAHAIACFVGGSLIARGGHNILEPARLGCPVVVGRHTFNFDDIVEPMRECHALHVADDARDVVAFLKQAATAPQDYTSMREKARCQASLYEGIADKYLQLLLSKTVQ